MATRQLQPASAPLRRSASDDSDRKWSRRLWLFLGLLALTSGLVIAYLDYKQPANNDVYVSVQVKTTVGANRVMVGRLSLLVNPEQEEGITRRRQQLEAVIGQSLADAYQGRLRPKLAEVQEKLYAAINAKLPRKLQVRDVLIQELLLGTS